MKAWQVHDHGEPRDVMRLDEVDEPTPGARELLVRVKSAALNFPDVLLCRGQYQARPELPFTPGVELCGEVIQIGTDAEGFEPGDRVIGTPSLPHGALAELTVLDVNETFAAPEVLDDDAAAAMHIAYQTAWFGLHRRAGLHAGETLVVHAGAGGVGGADKVKVATDLGANAVVDRREEDLVPALKGLTGRRGADVIFDPVGGAAYEASTRCVAFEGRILVVGFASGTIPAPPLAHTLVKNYSILGLHWGLYRQYDPGAVANAHTTLSAFAADGIVAPLIGDRLSLTDAADGLTKLAAGETVGRVVVRP